MKIRLSVSELTKDYGSFRAVDNLSFHIQQGEIFALIGPNGAGKSTTLKIVATVLAPTSGEVSIDDKSIFSDSKQVRKQITYLPEEAGIYKNMTGNSYLKFMSEIYSEKSAEQKRFFERGVEISGLGDRLQQKVSAYSKGMTRKLLLARALMVQPQLAILDEPTSGLDVKNSLQIRNMIKEFSGAGMSVLVSSHNMLEIEFLSDRIGLLHEGKLVDSGSAKELKQKYQAENLEEVFVLATTTKDE